MNTLNQEHNEELNLERIDINASDSEEELGDEWAYPYGKKERILTFIMAGGSSGWWNYVLRFPESDNENYTLYIENAQLFLNFFRFFMVSPVTGSVLLLNSLSYKVAERSRRWYGAIRVEFIAP